MEITRQDKNLLLEAIKLIRRDKENGCDGKSVILYNILYGKILNMGTSN